MQYKPNLLTLYSAFNDAGWPLKVGPVTRAIYWTQQRSAIYLLTNDVIHGVLRRITRTRLFRKIHSLTFGPTEFEAYVAQIRMRYRRNIKAIIAIAKNADIPIILIKQPMTTYYGRYQLISYEEEYKKVLNQFHNEQGLLRPLDFMLIEHHRLIEELEMIAQEENVPIVDNIAIVDRDRRRLATYVHLTEEGNLRLAEAVKAAIEPYMSQKNGITQSHSDQKNISSRP